MLHEETIDARTLGHIKRITADKQFNDFVLVGGTALSLQLGHRKSIDIDMFTPKAFHAEALATHLEQTYQAQQVGVLGNAVVGKIEGVHALFMAHQYPWVKSPLASDGIRMASLEDIGAMKFNAIVNSGSRLKDYVDVYALLERLNLDQMMGAYERKYPGSSRIIAKNALLYHKEIDFSAEIKLLKGPSNWLEIKKRLQDSVTHPKRLFQPTDDSARKDQQEDVSRGLRKGRSR